MRDLVLKNLTSGDKTKKILVSAETSERKGIRSIIIRHFVYLVKEADGDQAADNRPQPYLYIFKEHNAKEQRERFLCKMKGSVYASCKDKLYQIYFMHSLRIHLNAVSRRPA